MSFSEESLVKQTCKKCSNIALRYLIGSKILIRIVHLDFQNAFDTVFHCRFIRKLRVHGIKGNLLQWIKECLTDRMQQVVINNMSSCYGSAPSGEPQGSMFGPVLFILYVNDLLTTVDSKKCSQTIQNYIEQ